MLCLCIHHININLAVLCKFVLEGIVTLAVNTVDTTTIVQETGAILSLKCSFHPQVWLKDSSYLHDKFNLTIIKIRVTQQNDSGTYICLRKLAFPRKVIYQHIFNVFIAGN